MTRGSLYLLLSNAISELSTTTLFTCRPALTRKRVFIISEIKRKAKESLGSEKSGKANAFKFRFPPVNASECVLSLMRFVAAGCRHDAAAAKFNFNSNGIHSVFVSLGSMESRQETVSSGRGKLTTKDADWRTSETREIREESKAAKAQQRGLLVWCTDVNWKSIKFHWYPFFSDF